MHLRGNRGMIGLRSSLSGIRESDHLLVAVKERLCFAQTFWQLSTGFAYPHCHQHIAKSGYRVWWPEAGCWLTSIWLIRKEDALIKRINVSEAPGSTERKHRNTENISDIQDTQEHLMPGFKTHTRKAVWTQNTTFCPKRVLENSIDF